MADTVAIIGGRGGMGGGITARLNAAGLNVLVGSRTPGPEAVANLEAARGASIIILTVPPEAQAGIIDEITPGLVTGDVLVDCTVPLAWPKGRLPRYVEPVEGSAGQSAAVLVPDGVAVVSALHTVNAGELGDLANELDEDVLICGDDSEANARVSDVLGAIEGLRPVDVGPLELAGSLERLVPVLISLNRKHKIATGVRIAGLDGGDN